MNLAQLSSHSLNSLQSRSRLKHVLPLTQTPSSSSASLSLCSFDFWCCFDSYRIPERRIRFSNSNLVEFDFLRIRNAKNSHKYALEYLTNWSCERCISLYWILEARLEVLFEAYWELYSMIKALAVLNRYLLDASSIRLAETDLCWSETSPSLLALVEHVSELLRITKAFTLVALCFHSFLVCSGDQWQKTAVETNDWQTILVPCRTLS